MTRNYLTVVNKLWIIRNINEINCNFLDQTGNRYGVVLLHVGSLTPVMSIVVKGLVGIDCELISVNDALCVNYDQYWFANKWATIHQHLPYEVYNVWSKIIIIVRWNIIFKQFEGILDIYVFYLLHLFYVMKLTYEYFLSILSRSLLPAFISFLLQSNCFSDIDRACLQRASFAPR